MLQTTRSSCERAMSGVCHRVEGLKTMGSSCERAMSECAIG